MKLFDKLIALGAALSFSCLTMNAELTGRTAIEIRDMMGAGWNVGNSLDAYKENGLNAETSWGNPRISECLIETVYNEGFRTLRIPVSWGGHIYQGQYSSTIDQAWLNRVKEVVDYGYSRGMFVILNIHHDNGAEGKNQCFFPSNSEKNRSLQYVRDIWTQLADFFADYDQHLIFETLNEPRLVGDQFEWYFFPVDNPQQSQVREAIEVINDMNQEAVNAIRNGKGYNDDRMIMCPGYAACPDGIVSNLFRIPNDPTPNRIGLEVHAYRPTSLCLSGDRFTYQDSDRETILSEVFRPLSQKYGNTQIPIIIDETSIADKGQGEAERLKWIDCYFNLSKEYKMPCVLWDNGTTWETYQLGLQLGQWGDPNQNGECHGYMNRNTCQWNSPEIVRRVIEIVGVPANASVENAIADDIEVYSDNSVLYVSADNEINRIRLVDVSGKVVIDRIASTNKAEINVSSISQGMYIVVVETQGGSKVLKALIK